MKINQEIESLEQSLDNYDDTHPDYLPDYLKNLRNRIFACHQRIQSAMSAIVVLRQRQNLLATDKKLDDVVLGEIGSTTFQLLELISYLDLLHFITKEYPQTPNNFEKKITKVNTIRNRFAHATGITLREEYNWSTDRGKVNYRNTLRALVEAENLIQQSFSTIIGRF